MARQLKFNPPPGWPQPPDGWVPPKDWTPDPSWPDPPEGWQLWVPFDDELDAQRETADQTGSPSSLPNVESQDQTGQDLASRLALLESENLALKTQLGSAGSAEDLVILDDEWVLQDVGIYRYHHPLEDADAYKQRLKQLGGRIAEVVKAKRAIEMSSRYTYDGSLAKGRRMTGDLGKLMLRAYNAEVDNSVRSLRAGNVVTAKKRVDASRSAIRKLGHMMEMQISDEYHSLRLEEIELTADYLVKKQEEREAAREEKARLREERKVQAELKAQREKLDKERSHIMNALESLRKSGGSDADLERRLSELDGAIAQNDFRAANIRAGYVYVISNRGAFGPGVVKIGLTRRLEPLERVAELSGASVPFRFDVHCLFFTEDAVELEAELHRHFGNRRLNLANERKEFFFATPSEVRDVLVKKVGSLLEFIESADATEYLQSVHSWPKRQDDRIV